MSQVTVLFIHHYFKLFHNKNKCQNNFCLLLFVFYVRPPLQHNPISFDSFAKWYNNKKNINLGCRLMTKYEFILTMYAERNSFAYGRGHTCLLKWKIQLKWCGLQFSENQSNELTRQKRNTLPSLKKFKIHQRKMGTCHWMQCINSFPFHCAIAWTISIPRHWMM